MRIRRIGATALSALTGSISDAQHGSRGSSLHSDAHANTNDPTANQKAALAGTGTPSATDKYVSDSDARNTNSRTPSSHVLDGVLHTVSGLTIGHVLKATGAATAAFGQLLHSQLGTIGADDHHAQSHHAAHEPSGADAMAVDAVAGTGSLRTLGTTATSAAAGNDSRLSDARTPSAHAASHTTGADKIATGTPDGTKFLRDDFAWIVPTATAATLVGPKNLVSTVEVIAANTYVHVGRQFEIAATGSVELPATSTMEVTP